jgi:hypothetical protein
MMYTYTITLMCLLIYPSVHPFICPRFICLSNHPSIRPSIHLVCLSIGPSIYSSIQLSIHKSVCSSPSVCLIFRLSFRLYLCVPLCPSIHLSTCPSYISLSIRWPTFIFFEVWPTFEPWMAIGYVWPTNPITRGDLLSEILDKRAEINTTSMFGNLLVKIIRNW